MKTIEPNADLGFAVRRNGTILLRTASDTEWQAMGNGLVLVFDADPGLIDWADPQLIRDAWERCAVRCGEEIEIVPVRAVERIAA